MPVRELRPGEEVVMARPSVRPLRPDEEVISDDMNPVVAFGRGANVGIAETFGAPVDLVNAGLRMIGLGSDEPILGSKSIRRAMSAFGMAPPPGEEDPHTFAGDVGRVVGGATAALVPVGAAARPAAAVMTGARAAPATTAGRIVHDVARSAVEHPKRFLAVEGVTSGLAGTGGFVASSMFPDSDAAQALGEILFASAPAVLPFTIGGMAMRFGGRAMQPFTEAGGLERAARRMKEAARDSQAAATELREGEVLPEANLTPAQRTGDRGLLSLERSVIESSERLKGEADEQIAAANKAIRNAMRKPGRDVPAQRAQETLEQQRQHMIALLETRRRIAAKIADERISALGPTVTRQQANEIAREELQRALIAARRQETQLWNAVPKDVPVGTAATREAFDNLVASTAQAQQEDVPAIARRLLDPDSDDFLGDITTVRELQGLRSKLLENARKARSAGDFNTARMADDLADALLLDLGASRDAVQGEAGPALRTALDFSADLNERFTRGPVGRLLGFERRGGPTTPAELTLERTVGRGGPVGLVEEQALLRAVERHGNDPAMREAIANFLRDDFRRMAVKNGQIDAAGAQRFFKRHTDSLRELPELRQQFEDAVQAGDAARLAGERAEGVASRFASSKASRAAVFIQAPVEKALARVAGSRHPGRTMRELVREARRDKTGDALAGLKTGFSDFLMQLASTGRRDAEGEMVMSGAVLRKLMSEGPTARMAEALLTPQERRRFQVIANTAERIEKAFFAKPRPEGVIADQPGRIASIVARVGGAQLGRVIAAATGGGTVQTPGILSGAFKRALQAHVRDPAKRLLEDAIQDEKLFRALLTEATTPRREAFIRRQLNGWAASAARDAGGELPEPEPEPEERPGVTITLTHPAGEFPFPRQP